MVYFNIRIPSNFTTIAFITDIHLDEQFPKEIGVDSWRNWNWILKDIRYRNIHEIIFGGDIGEHTSNTDFFESLKMELCTRRVIDVDSER